jgi:hypothetical protein
MSARHGMAGSLRPRLLRALVLLATAGAALAGCAPPGALLPGPVPQAVRGKLPDAVLVTRLDSTRVTLYAPELRGDTLVGWTEPPASTKPGRRFQLRVAVADIRALNEGEADGGGGAGIAVLFLAVMAVIGIMTKPIAPGL